MAAKIRKMTTVGATLRALITVTIMAYLMTVAALWISDLIALQERHKRQHGPLLRVGSRAGSQAE